MIWILIVPGLLAAYFIVLRPVLHAVPAFKAFYAEADGFRQKAWALTGRSLTLAWSYILMGFGFVMQWLDPISTALGDPQLKDQVTSALQLNPTALGYFAMLVSAVTIAARLRSIGKGA